MIINSKTEQRHHIPCTSEDIKGSFCTPEVIYLRDCFGTDVIENNELTGEIIDWVTLFTFVDSNPKTENFLNQSTSRITGTADERIEYISFHSPAYGGDALFYLFFKKIPCTRVLKGNRITELAWAMHISFALSHWSEQSETPQKSQHRGHALLYEALSDLETLFDTELQFLRGVKGMKLRASKFRIKRIGLSQNRYFEKADDLMSGDDSGAYRDQIVVEFADKLRWLKWKCPHLERLECPDLDMLNQIVSFENLEAFEGYDTFYEDEYGEAYRQILEDNSSTILVRTKLYRPVEADRLDSIDDKTKLRCFDLASFEVGFRAVRNSLKNHFPLSVEKLLRIEKKGQGKSSL